MHSGKPFGKSYSREDKKNDYCQHFVNTGERPPNFIRDIRPEQRFAGIYNKSTSCFITKVSS